MPVPLMIAGGAMAAGGLLGSALSNGRGPQAQRTYWGGSEDAENAYRQQQQGRDAYGYGQQQAALQDYQGVINGTAPSLAALQMAHGVNAAATNASDIAAGARGGGGMQLEALQQAQRMNAGAAADANGQAAMLRAQEIAQARDSRASLATTMQGAGQQGLQSVNQAAFQNTADVQAQNLATDQAYRQRQQQMWGSLMSMGGQVGAAGASGLGGAKKVA